MHRIRPRTTTRGLATLAAATVAIVAGGGDAAAKLYLPALLVRSQAAPSPPPVPPTPATPAATSSPASTRPSPTPTVPPATPAGPSHYVSAAATGDGDGTFGRPWTLQQALDHPAGLQPGSTVWLRGGRYTGTHLVDASLGRISFLCRTTGAPGAPIIFRNHAGERATIDGEDNQVALFVQSCRHTWFWGLEVMSSAPVRSPSRAYVYVTAPDVKFIHMVLHDLGDGIDLWTAATDAELYGSVIYHNGWDEPNGGHGHGIYAQNNSAGTKRLHDNIFFSQYGFNVRIWSTNQFVDNFDLQGNIAFNGGSLSEFASRKFNLFVVSNNPSAPTRNLVVRQNYTYAGRSTTTPPCNAFGPNYGAIDMRLEDNVFLGQFRVTGPYVNATIRGNRILGGTVLPFLSGTGFDPADYPDNTYAQDVPITGAEVFVRPSRYERGRAHLAVYNWAGADSVSFDARAAGLAAGDGYELAYAMDLYDDVRTGTVDADGAITIPMTGHTHAQAIGSTKAPVSQLPEFGTFVLRRVAAAGAPQPHNSLARLRSGSPWPQK